MEESWSRTVTVEGEAYEVRFFRRPFREGLEVVVDVRGTELRLSELGLGERALLELASARIRDILQRA